MKVQSNSSKFYIPQFKLDSGELLENVEIAYSTEGRLSENRDNAILVFHALTGSHMLAGSYQQLDNPDIPWNEELETGWWDGFVGPNKIIDTNRYFVVCANYLGGCYGSTGPSSINNSSNEKYGYDFPSVSFKDIEISQKLLLEYLNVKSLEAVIGPSIGGLMALEFCTMYPEYVNKLISISNLVSYDEEGQSPFLARYNRQKAVTISARLVGDYSLDEALKFLVGVVEQNTPQANIAYKGESEEYKKTNTELYVIFALALITAYLAMCAQFESWKHPFTIMLTVPMAILGGLLGLLVVGSSLNVYSQIALIILIGLSAKNGILIVEFANQLRKEGKNIEVAVFEAAAIRLRPILMTSLSTVIGVLPLIIGTGPGAASRLTVGITIFGGMLFSTFFNI